MFVTLMMGDTTLLVPEHSIRAVSVFKNQLTIYTVDGDSIPLESTPARVWEAFMQIQKGMGRPEYAVDLTWLAESPAPEAVATGD